MNTRYFVVLSLALASALALQCAPAAGATPQLAAAARDAEPRSPALLRTASGAEQQAPGTASAAPVASRNVRVVWRVNFGDKVSDAFKAWARQSRKWQVVWEAPELVAQASVDVEGSFEDAVTKVIDALNRGNAGLHARFYVDSVNNVLRVVEKK
ncbi:MAG: hypothetical protein JWP36_2338 [Paucimonas sp.]|nr:hypothetical protein [Paucimonas sp.]